MVAHESTAFSALFYIYLLKYVSKKINKLIGAKVILSAACIESSAIELILVVLQRLGMFLGH